MSEIIFQFGFRLSKLNLDAYLFTNAAPLSAAVPILVLRANNADGLIRLIWAKLTVIILFFRQRRRQSMCHQKPLLYQNVRQWISLRAASGCDYFNRNIIAVKAWAIYLKLFCSFWLFWLISLIASVFRGQFVLPLSALNTTWHIHHSVHSNSETLCDFKYLLWNISQLLIFVFCSTLVFIGASYR